ARSRLFSPGRKRPAAPSAGGQKRTFLAARPWLADAESGLCLCRDGAKGGGIMYGQIREHLAIDLDVGFEQSIDQAAVGQAVQACSSVDTGNPQRAEFALLLAAIAVRVLAGLDDCLLGGAIDLAAGVVIALCLAKNLLVTATGRHSTFDSCH